MTTVIGVRFREVGKIYYFAPGEFVLSQGDKVIVETARGLECGIVVLGNKDIEDREIISPLKEVRRIVTEQDVAQMNENREKERLAYRICKEKIIQYNLDMKLISAECAFDNSKLLFYFTADGRIDFRELVKELAAIFKLRIELRQVGVRDETKIVGGIGSCGRALCCHSYLTDFVPVSIKMAKDQSLSLNPQKISGVCGRLMCCLKNESDTYEELNKNLPKEGDLVYTDDGRSGVVSSVSVLRQKVKVMVQTEGGDKEIIEYEADSVSLQDNAFTKKAKNKA